MPGLSEGPGAKPEVPGATLQGAVSLPVFLLISSTDFSVKCWGHGGTARDQLVP